MNNNCPVCDSSLKKTPPDSNGADSSSYNCPRCGKFRLAGSVIATLKYTLQSDPDAVAKISHAIRKLQSNDEYIKITTHTVDEFLKQALPRPMEQADLLIRWIANDISGIGETTYVGFSTHGSIIGSKSPAGFELILDYLFDKGLLIGRQAKNIMQTDEAEATLSFEGWEYYEQLKSGSAVYKKAFMAMKFGDPILTNIFHTVFKLSAERAGFELQKLDDVPKAGLIDDRLRAEIQSSDFIIADLTHDNLGAYWEAGYAEGLGKPVIYTCEKSKFELSKTHFDTNHHLTIQWDASNPSIAGEALVSTIRATLPHLAKMVDQKS